LWKQSIDSGNVENGGRRRVRWKSEAREERHYTINHWVYRKSVSTVLAKGLRKVI
jgi:hypothetical protein